MKGINRNKQRSKEDVEEIEVFAELSPAEVETNGPETKYGIVEGANLVKVRREPWTDDDNVLEVLRTGDKVKILGKVDGFYKVSTAKNSVAYISSSFIKEI